MISAKAATQKLFQKDFDEYGDSYVKDITPDRIQQIMDGIKVVSFLLYACCLYSFHTFLGLCFSLILMIFYEGAYLTFKSIIHKTLNLF